MRKSIIALVLGALVSHHIMTFAQTPSPGEIKLKQKVVAVGTEQNVRIKLKSEEMLKGRIAEIKNDSFTLQFVDTTGQVINQVIAYGDLSKISRLEDGEGKKAFKRGLLQGAGGVAAAVGALLIISLIARVAID